MEVYLKLISIVVPCYNEEETVEIFYNETEKINHNYKIINLSISLLMMDQKTELLPG